MNWMPLPLGRRYIYTPESPLYMESNRSVTRVLRHLKHVSWRFLGVHEASLLGEEVLVLVLPKISFPYFAALSISTITSSSEVQIMQTRTLNCRARRDLQLSYSNFINLTSLRSPKWAHKVLLSWNPRISRDLIGGWIGLLINLPCLQFLHTQAILSLRNLLLLFGL